MTEVVSPHNNKIGPLPDSKIIAGRKITEISAASVFNVMKIILSATGISMSALLCTCLNNLKNCMEKFL